MQIGANQPHWLLLVVCVNWNGLPLRPSEIAPHVTNGCLSSAHCLVQPFQTDNFLDARWADMFRKAAMGK